MMSTLQKSSLQDQIKAMFSIFMGDFSLLDMDDEIAPETKEKFLRMRPFNTSLIFQNDLTPGGRIRCLSTSRSEIVINDQFINSISALIASLVFVTDHLSQTMVGSNWEAIDPHSDLTARKVLSRNLKRGGDNCFLAHVE